MLILNEYIRSTIVVMANQILLISSMIMTIVHVVNISDLSWYSLFVMHGCFTSILNHGMTSRTIQLYDRTNVGQCSHGTLYVCIIPGCVIIWAAGVYFFSKKNGKVVSHALAHALITVAHVQLLTET